LNILEHESRKQKKKKKNCRAQRRGNRLTAMAAVKNKRGLD